MSRPHLRALVRRPGPRLPEGIVTHLPRRGVEVRRALIQWHGYVDTLAAAGWEPVQVPGLDECPDAVFVEDTVVVHEDLAVLTRPGAATRRAEVDAVGAALQAQGYELARIEPPGTLDGGDVLRSGRTVWVGSGGRSNQAGIDQLAAHLSRFDLDVVPVPLGPALHLKSAVTALPDGTVIGDPALLLDPSAFPRFLPVPEPTGAAVLLLGGTKVLVSASAPGTAELLRGRGLHVMSVDIGEFEKLEGGVTCLSVRLRRGTPVAAR